MTEENQAHANTRTVRIMRTGALELLLEVEIGDSTQREFVKFKSFVQLQRFVTQANLRARVRKCVVEVYGL